MTAKLQTLVSSEDPREAPAYTLAEVSHYLNLPQATVRSWVVGRPYPVKSGQRYFQPVTVAPGRPFQGLSFLNLVEIHVLSAIRREYHVPLAKVRKAIAYLRREFGSQHPLAEHKIETDGRKIFVRWLGKLIGVSEEGQLAMPEIVDVYLKRIDWDSAGLARRLYPFTRKAELSEPKVIVMDPFVSFGRPVLVGTGIPTAIIAERFKAGETSDQLAHDYGRQRVEIEEAIRCELRVEAA